jgi:hypothetical protein
LVEFYPWTYIGCGGITFLTRLRSRISLCPCLPAFVNKFVKGSCIGEYENTTKILYT